MTPTEIKAARTAAGLTQQQAAALIHCGASTWQSWELGTRKMHPAFWELFNLKVKNVCVIDIERMSSRKGNGVTISLHDTASGFVMHIKGRATCRYSSVLPIAFENLRWSSCDTHANFVATVRGKPVLRK